MATAAAVLMCLVLGALAVFQVVLARAGLVSIGVSEQVVRRSVWVVAAHFLLGIGLNLASRSRPERWVMSPVSAVLCALSAVVALG